MTTTHWISAIGTIAAVTAMPAGAYAQAATPEAAAVVQFAARENRTLYVDPRVALVAGAQSGFGAMRSSVVTAQIAQVLNAAIRRFEDAVVCRPVAKGKRPFDRCRVEGADAVVGVSAAELRGQSATVYVTIHENGEHGMVGTQWEVSVRRERAGWVFVEMRLAAASS